MSKARNHRKLSDLVNHRENWYFKTLDELFAGKVPPEYVNERWNKYKAIKSPFKSL